MRRSSAEGRTHVTVVAAQHFKAGRRNPMRNTPGSGWGRLVSAGRKVDFSERLSPNERVEFESLRTFSDYPPAAILFVEQQAPDNVLTTATIVNIQNASSARGAIPRRCRCAVYCADESSELGKTRTTSGRTSDRARASIGPFAWKSPLEYPPSGLVPKLSTRR